MRRLPSPHQAFDNPVNSRFELYEDGCMVAYLKYRMEAETIVFLICQASPKPSHVVTEAHRDNLAGYRSQVLCAEAMRDTHRRHLRAKVVSRSMKAMFGPHPVPQGSLS